VLRAAEGALPLYQRWQAHLRAADLTRDLAARARHLFRAKAQGRVRAALAAARDRIRCGAPLEAARLYQLARAGLQDPFPSVRAAFSASARPTASRWPASQPRHAGNMPGRSRAAALPGASGRRWPRRAGRRAGSSRCSRRSPRARSAGADPLAVTTVEARAEAMRGEYSRAEELAAAALPLARERGDEEAADPAAPPARPLARGTGVKDGARSPKNARRC